ncbi:palmdelphin-like [Pholidichthys leucotaenia]
MEESDLLKERLQAITEKHRLQEDIRQKKLELDHEKFKLQHLKKKSLREKWLLQDSHDAADPSQQQKLLSDQQQTRALQLNIHRIEMEVESLEREESVISTNESFIVNRLKAVEKSPEEIIKEAQDSFVPEPLEVIVEIPDIPETFTPPFNKPSDPNTLRETLFAMETNVTKHMMTGENTVLSTASVSPEELYQHAGLKVYEDSRKSVYAQNSNEGSHDHNYVSKLSASEVEQLLRSAAVHRQGKHLNYHLGPSRKEEHGFSNHEAQRKLTKQCDHREHCNNHAFLGRHDAETGLCCRGNWQEKPCDHQENRYSRNKDRSLHKGLSYHYGYQHDQQYSLYQLRNCHSFHEDGSAGHQPNSSIRSSSRMTGSGPNGYFHPRSHDQEVVRAYQPQLRCTASSVPPADYMSMEEKEHHRYRPPSYQSCSQSESRHNQSTAQYNGPTPGDRIPSPLYRDDASCTILTALDSTEPITAIFMGFQTAQDDSEHLQEFEGCLKAELVIIEDNEEKEKKSPDYVPTGAASRGDRQTDTHVGPGIRKIQKKHQPCCTVS